MAGDGPAPGMTLRGQEKVPGATMGPGIYVPGGAKAEVPKVSKFLPLVPKRLLRGYSARGGISIPGAVIIDSKM